MFVRVLAAVVALLPLVAGGASATSCAPAVEWNGVTYEQIGDVSVGVGAKLGEGVRPPCERERGCSAPDAETATVMRVRGVDPDVAVTLAQDPTPYAAPGYFVELPTHPLHSALFGGPRRPIAKAGWWCRPPFELRAEVSAVPPAVFRVDGEESEVNVRYRDGDEGVAIVVDAETRIEGLAKSGLPYVERGDWVSIVSRECLASGGRAQLVAERMRPA